MVRRTLTFAALCLSLSPFPAAAQDPEATPANAAPLAVISMMQVISQRLDAIQARLDARNTRDAVAWIDGVDEVGQGIIYLQAWAFSCSEDARVALVIDGIELSNRVAHVARKDVRDAYDGPACGVEARPGVNAMADLSVFEPGMQGDHRHRIKVRVYDWQNKMTDSEEVTIALSATFTGRRDVRVTPESAPKR